MKAHSERCGESRPAALATLGLMSRAREKVVTYARVMSVTTGSVVIGLDGGGTKTECMLMSEEGVVLARGLGGPSNPSRIGFGSAFNGVRAAMTQALEGANCQTSHIAAICAGLGGVAQPADAEKIRALLAGEYPSAAIRVCTDFDLVFAAVPPGAALLLIAGTGSVAIGRNKAGERARIGGHGPVISDEGSAYDIGRRAVAASVREFDRTGKNSALGERILGEMGSPNWVEIRRRVQGAPDDVFPRLFSVTAVMADNGDQTSQEILRGAAYKLAEMASSLAERLKFGEDTFHLVLTGGMIGRSKYFDGQLQQRLRTVSPNGRRAVPNRGPAETAAHLALEMLREKNRERT
jgi:glucosamine kinase